MDIRESQVLVVIQELKDHLDTQEFRDLVEKAVSVVTLDTLEFQAKKVSQAIAAIQGSLATQVLKELLDIQDWRE